MAVLLAFACVPCFHICYSERWYFSRIAGNFYILVYYLPIYFRAVRGTDATESGIWTIRLILGLTIISGLGITLPGTGLGLCFNVYYHNCTEHCTTGRGSDATAILLCALVVSAAQSIFQNEVFNTLSTASPNITPASLFAIGASEIQTTFSKAELPGNNMSYMKGLHMAFALSIPMAGVATLVALGQN
ncbi:hypothetical protein BJ875DRAFT_437811 [Amylocarpus encephaloides]|uniref:Uncharacterized protein n=1 Tax=Amylocarpus encephaloides TaxID=45428 RepID=A0A9P7YQU4_9HELO|nr:hypothetical protein BJ875DRAFT_437811 [Amylocarpus encephaloides]